MKRAGVFIGVGRAKGLPPLADAIEAAERLAAWAVRSQKIDAAAIATITDRHEPVTFARVFSAVESLLAGDPEQLFVYFSGHGLYVHGSEVWLLSAAARNPNEAIHLAGSVEKARYGAVRHVVFFSDACRTAATSVAHQGLRPGELFAAPAGGVPSRAVDQFFATLLGEPALEVRAPGEPHAPYRAVYSAVLLEALEGRFRDAVEEVVPGEGEPYHAVFPWPLADTLAARVPARLTEAGLPLTLEQTPDAIITSRRRWISRLATLPRAAAARRARKGTAASTDPPSAPAVARAFLADALSGESSGASGQPAPQPAHQPARRRRPLRPEVDAAARLARALRAEALALAADERAWPPAASAGVRVHGARLAGARLADGLALRRRPGGSFAPLPPSLAAPTLALVRVDTGHGALVPVFPGRTTELVFDGCVLVSFAVSVPVRRAASTPLDTQRDLRAAASVLARRGLLRLDDATSTVLASRLAAADPLDPALALLAAYAWHERGEEERVAAIAVRLRALGGASLVDLALLDGGPLAVPFPGVPLASAGWALLGARGRELPTVLAALTRHRLPSPWTVVDRRGAALVDRAFRARRPR